jgi:hypothetical protein
MPGWLSHQVIDWATVGHVYEFKLYWDAAGGSGQLG